MIIGFTGTRSGLGSEQGWQLVDILRKASTFVHGGCIGADTEASWIAHDMGIVVECFPGLHPAYIGNYYADIVHDGQKASIRDKTIVELCDLLVAAPYSNVYDPNSVVWQNLEYAKSIGKDWVVLRHPEKVFY